MGWGFILLVRYLILIMAVPPFNTSAKPGLANLFYPLNVSKSVARSVVNTAKLVLSLGTKASFSGSSLAISTSTNSRCPLGHQLYLCLFYPAPFLLLLNIHNHNQHCNCNAIIVGAPNLDAITSMTTSIAVIACCKTLFPPPCHYHYYDDDHNAPIPFAGRVYNAFLLLETVIAFTTSIYSSNSITLETTGSPNC